MSDKEVILKRKPTDEQEAVDLTKKSKLSFNMGLKKKSPTVATENKPLTMKSSLKPKMKIAPVSIKLGAAKPKEPEKKILKPSGTAAKAFADESDEEEEDMPPEAKMRMKNIGRETPTSAGPNSFNKGKMGFSSPGAKWKTPRLKSNAEQPRSEEPDDQS